MEKLTREPVMIGGLVTALFGALVLFMMQMGLLSWNAEQLASFNNLIAALVALAVPLAPLVVAYFVRRKVTPVADPRTADGDPAVLLMKTEG